MGQKKAASDGEKKINPPVDQGSNHSSFLLRLALIIILSLKSYRIHARLRPADTFTLRGFVPRGASSRLLSWVFLLCLSPSVDKWLLRDYKKGITGGCA